MAISQETFSPAEAYALQSQWYANLWDNAMAQAYWDLANSAGAYSSAANTTLWGYDNLLNYISWNEGRLQGVAWKLYNDLVNDINTQREYVYDMFWPEGLLTQEVNKYYDDLWNYLATDAWRQAAIIAAQWQHSGASLWAIRAQQNEAYNESFARYVQAKEQQINAKQQIASNLINFMSTLRREYGDTTNQYIIELYKRANDLYNTVAQSAMQDIDSYNKLRFSSGWWSSSTLLPNWYSYDANWNIIDNNGHIIKSEADSEADSEAEKSMALEQLWQNIDNVNNTNYGRKIWNWIRGGLTARLPWAAYPIWTIGRSNNKNNK